MSDSHLAHVESFSRSVFTSDGRLLRTMREHATKAWPGVRANYRRLPDAVSRWPVPETEFSAAA